MVDKSAHMHAVTQHGLVGYFTFEALGGGEKKTAALAHDSGSVYQFDAGGHVRPTHDKGDFAGQFKTFSEEQMVKLREGTELDQLAIDGVLTQAQKVLDVEAKDAAAEAMAEAEVLTDQGVTHLRPRQD